jgi:uncharacterized protein (TIGR00369 family)
MAEPVTDIDSLLAIFREMHESLPFNRLLGLKVEYLRTDGAGFSFTMKDELVGNPVHGILHGGVISAVLDATGGLTITASAMERMQGLSHEEIARRLSRMGTIDIRVDYLRPGKGTRFTSTGTIMRAGNKVAVTRMELRNQDDVLIAVGTGAYMIG